MELVAFLAAPRGSQGNVRAVSSRSTCRRRRSVWVAAAGLPSEGDSTEQPQDPEGTGGLGDTRSDDTPESPEGKELVSPHSNPLFEMLSAYKPSDLVNRFKASSSPEVNSAFQATLRRVIGSMPSETFEMQIRTILGNLISLMQTCIMTGYLMRNAEYRLHLTRSFKGDRHKLGASTEDLEIKGGKAVLTFPDGSVKEVRKQIKNPLPAAPGELTVVRWDIRNLQLDAEKYVEELRNEAQGLRAEMTRLKRGGPASGNELSELFATLEPGNLQDLQDMAGEEATDAMKLLINNVLGADSSAVNPLVPIEMNRDDLGQLLFYSMVSGYFLREAEVRRYCGDRQQGFLPDTADG